jgi:hypothetical protein
VFWTSDALFLCSRTSTAPSLNPATATRGRGRRPWIRCSVYFQRRTPTTTSTCPPRGGCRRDCAAVDWLRKAGRHRQDAALVRGQTSSRGLQVRILYSVFSYVLIYDYAWCFLIWAAVLPASACSVSSEFGYPFSQVVILGYYTWVCHCQRLFRICVLLV